MGAKSMAPDRASVFLAAAMLSMAGYAAAPASVPAADAAGKAATATPYPILFATHFPIPNDFATVGSTFANHLAGVAVAGRGGDLHVRYPDGTLRNLTQEAGYGTTGANGFQDHNAIAVRDPAMHWSGTRALFSMVIGAPAKQFELKPYRWQLYEVTGLGLGESAAITKVQNQPADYNNVQPAYLSDDRIVFVSDRPRGGEAHLYPQRDEYESTFSNTGLWRLNPGTGELILMEHSPSGSFNPIVDSFGRVLFTRWDHLQRDQQNDEPNNPYGCFNWSSEAADAIATPSRTEIFPEPRVLVNGSGVNPFTINQFFPWAINQDGTGEEIVNHIGRHELHGYFDRSFTGDSAEQAFLGATSGRANPNSVQNVLMMREDPTVPGRYYAIDAPEFFTRSGGQVIRFDAPPSLNPSDVVVTYGTPRATASFVDNGAPVPPEATGHYRNVLPLSDGQLIVAHTSEARAATNLGTRAAPNSNYQYRLKSLATGPSGFLEPGATLTGGIVRTISYWDPDVLVNYTGPMWELSPVEVRPRAIPAASAETTAAPEASAYQLEDVDPAQFRADLAARGLAVVVMRDVTSRDKADRQQPVNLRVPGGVQSVTGTGTLFDIGHFQFFQADQVRGLTFGAANPTAGRRVLAQVLHDADALAANGPNPDGPAGSVPIFADGSVAAYVPTRRALSWQSTAPDGTPVVRERYWLTMQPGEVRACDGCHGVNRKNQSGAEASQAVSLAFRKLLADWRVASGAVFSNGFE